VRSRSCPTGALPSLLTVGEVAARSGLSISALRFYESKGLIKSGRTPGNQRRYPREVLRRVAVIKVAQRAGIPLDQIRAVFRSLPSERTPTQSDWAVICAQWRTELDERIRRLTRLRNELTNCIGRVCLSLQSCPLYNPADEVGRRGPGATLLEPD
jgi:MerR family transcriptional regulator, redox-sensitive transcriptional activator SoxR